MHCVIWKKFFKLLCELSGQSFVVSHNKGRLLYLSDHGKPVDISRSTAEATILQGAEKQEVELKTAGLRFEATGSCKIANAKVVVTVSQPGKAPVNVRFTLK